MTPCGAALAQAGPEGKRPRIGLALSGGGARGAAHIGVLKVLEELRVPVHCIAGTSMGAVVGCAYAAGTTPAGMEQLIKEVDWGDVFRDAPPRGELSARRKLEDYKPLFATEFGVRDGEIQLPAGVVAGVTIEGFLRRLAAPSAAIDNFDRLPIPYRAVAADIATGRAVVLSRGSLVQAMRASMAIPGAVAPVQIDGRLLVDGGIADNLPIGVERKLCGDVVIAVDIGTPPLKREQITSVLSIVGQLVTLLGKESVDRQLATLGPNDMVVKPELGDIAAGSFDRQQEAIDIGEAATRALASTLARYAIPAAEYTALRRTQVVEAKALGRVDEIRFEGLQRSNPDVLAELMLSKPGEELDDAQLVSDLRRIYGRGDFEAVDYHIESGPGSRALVIPVREKSTGPNYLRIGLGLATDFRDEAVFNLLLSYRRTWLNPAGAEWLSEVQLGQNSYLFSEFYQPLQRRGGAFVAPYVQLGRNTLPFHVADQRVAEYRVDEARIGFDIGTTLGTWGEVRLGVLARSVDADVATGSLGLPDAEGVVRGVRLRMVGDRLDSPWFPRSGQRVVISAFESVGADAPDENYRRLEAHWSGAFSFARHTFTVTATGGSSGGTLLPPDEAFFLGGPFRLSGYRINQFAGENFALGTVRYYNQLARLPTVLGTGAYVGASLEVGRVGRVFGNDISTGTLWSTSVYLAAETFLGPAYFGIGISGKGRHSVYLLLGGL